MAKRKISIEEAFRDDDETVRVEPPDQSGFGKVEIRAPAVIPERQEVKPKPVKPEAYYDEDEDDYLKANEVALKAMFSKHEMAKFKAQYIRLIKQFKEDVLFSEELQVGHAVKLEILMDRCLIATKELIDEANKLEKLRNELMELKDGEDLEKDEKILYLTKQMEAVRASSRSKNDEHLKLFDSHKAIMNNLKATREQRIKSLEGANQSFVDVIKKLQKSDSLSSEGVELAVYKYAVVKELMRLSMPHKYMDGSVTNPVLSSESLKIQDMVYELQDENEKKQG